MTMPNCDFVFLFQVFGMSTTNFSTNLSEVDSMPDNTTPYIYFNQTNFYEVASIPVSGLTYTLFGFTCFLACLGLSGNISILAITLKSRDKWKGHNILISALAITDSAALVSLFLTQPCFYDVLGMDVRAITTIGCKLFISVLQSATLCSSMVVVLISVERFLVVWLPHKSRFLLSRKTILRSVLLGVAPIIIICFSVSILYAEINEDGICDPNFQGHIYSSVLKTMPDTTVYNALMILLISPSVILFILTPMTVFKLYKRIPVRRQLTSKERAVGNFQISVKLTAVSMTYLTLIVLPLMTVFGLASNGIKIEKDVRSGLILSLLLNHSANFVLYNIFDGEFRKKMAIVFGFGKRDQDGEPKD